MPPQRNPADTPGVPAKRALLLAALWCLTVAPAPARAQTWLQTLAPTNNWRSVASSADGTKLVAAVNGGSIYTSSDSGNSWSPTSAPSNYWASVASSADGTRLVAAMDASPPGLIYTSTNSGITWRPSNAPANRWSAVASTAGGTKLFALWELLIVSTNFGTSWTTNTTPAQGRAGIFIACSADGNTLLLGGV